MVCKKNTDMDIFHIDFNTKETKYIQVYDKIRELITEGVLKANEKMPPIRKLSAYLSVNSITVVKAYELLETDGYVYKRQGSGTFVNSRNSSDDTEKTITDGIYRLDSGNPSSEIFPIDDFKKAINMALESDPCNIFNYDEGNGLPELKKVMREYLSTLGIDTTEKNIMIISGAQQGIDIISKTLINYSDVVFIEEPTYSGAIDVLKSRSAKLVSIPMLEDGIDIGVLKLKLEKIRPKMIYVMPNFQNPTGISYSEYKKKKLVEMAEEYDFYILEDDFISDFKFMSENNRTLKSYDRYNRVIYIKSFSKILMPGLRVGLMDIPLELMKRAVICKYSSDISTSTLIQKSLYFYMERFDWKAHMSAIEKVYTEKFIYTYDYLKKKIGEKCRIVRTDGGINFFIELKRPFYSKDFVDYMFKKNVALKSGSNYYDNDIDDRFFRINIANEPLNRIKEAIDIISDGLDHFYMEYRDKEDISGNYAD